MTDDTVERGWGIVAKAIYEAAEPFEYKEILSWEDFEPEARAALSAMPEQEVTVKDADIEKAVLVLLGKSKEHAPGVDYVASRTMKKSEWCDRMKAALRAISEGE